jgi:HAD superfamily hydrolase (TIGR01509 family)
MSGGLLVNALLRETGRQLSPQQAKRLQDLHRDRYAALTGSVKPLAGAGELLAELRRVGVPWAIATSSRLESARASLALLGVTDRDIVVTRDQVPYAKPDPDLFLEAAERVGVAIESSIVVGDSVWDLLAAQRARAIGVGVLSGGYGQDELERAGAYRVYADPRDLLNHIDELGVRSH